MPRMPLIWEVACRLGMASVLDAGAADLGRLSDAEAVELFAGLLWADSAARGIRAEIDVPRSIDARDGGIDATVRAPAGTAGQGVIGPGVTRYRIKSGRGFNPSSKEARRRLLFRPGGGGGLRPRIKECLDAGEAFVVVLFGTDAPDRGRDSEDLIREDLAAVDPSYEDARVEVWRQNRLAGYIGSYPALQRRLGGVSDVPFLAHSQWASTSEDMARRFVPGRPQEALIARARGALRRADGADVRIAGRPGSGKTRIAHEITRADDLSALALYFENPMHVRRGNFLNSLLEDRGASAILVVDECDTENWYYLRDRTATAGGRIRLVTIYIKKDSEDCYVLDDLGLPEIREIIGGMAPGPLPAQSTCSRSGARRRPGTPTTWAGSWRPARAAFPAPRLARPRSTSATSGRGWAPATPRGPEKESRCSCSFQSLPGSAARVPAPANTNS